jgi:hypothetical protein
MIKGEPNMSDTNTLLNKIREKKKALMVEFVDDCVFDKSKMEAQFTNTLTIAKWINKKLEWGNLFRIQEEIRKKKWRKLYEFYKVESNFKINTKEELAQFIESDVNYTEIHLICQELEEVIKYILSAIDNLKAKNFEVQTFVKYLMFINGK